jgi:1-acyl-sn-glycerol-3-phosphate acyltransferase
LIQYIDGDRAHYYRKRTEVTIASASRAQFLLECDSISEMLGTFTVPLFPDPITDPEAYVERVLEIPPAQGVDIILLNTLIQRWFEPEFSNTHLLPDGPALFVGNHSFCAIDAFVFHFSMMNELGIFLRPLGDKTLFSQRQYADLVHRLGAVHGDGQVMEGLMAAGENLLLYPGGTHEAIKGVDQRYQLQWKNRFGFIHRAAQAGFTIVPFAAVGPDEYYGQWLTSAEVMASPPFRWLQSRDVIPHDVRDDLVPPLPAGLFGGPLPKPVKTFFQFGEPIDLSHYAGRKLTKRQASQLRDRVAHAIETEIAALLVQRAEKPPRESLLRRIMTL